MENDLQDGSVEDVLKPPYDQALKLGLKPYGEFHEKMSPLFARIRPEERDGHLRNIYRLAAEKVLIDKGKTDIEDQARELDEDAKKLESASADVKDAALSLLKAVDVLPREFPGRSEVEQLANLVNDLGQDLAHRGLDRARYASAFRNVGSKGVVVSADSRSSLQYAVPLASMAEVAPDLPAGENTLDSYIRTLTGPTVESEYRYRFPSGRPLTATDHWLISAIHESLPKAPAGKRLRFSRDKVICMTFEAAWGDPMRGPEGVRSARRRKSNQ